jgi:hypothetical protein
MSDEQSRGGWIFLSLGQLASSPMETLRALRRKRRQGWPQATAVGGAKRP